VVAELIIARFVLLAGVVVPIPTKLLPGLTTKAFVSTVSPPANVDVAVVDVAVRNGISRVTPARMLAAEILPEKVDVAVVEVADVELRSCPAFNVTSPAIEAVLESVEAPVTDNVPLETRLPAVHVAEVEPPTAGTG